MVETYAYRLPRFEVALPIQFQTDTATIEGHTRNLSDTGLLASFVQPLLNGSAGVIRLRFGSSSFEMEAHVTHAEFLDAGLNFLFASDQERQLVRTLVRVLSKRTR